jgi:hypothetical protein
MVSSSDRASPSAQFAIQLLSSPLIQTWNSTNSAVYSHYRLLRSTLQPSDESTHATTILGSWCDFPVIPQDNIMEISKDKGKQGKGKDQTGEEEVMSR